MSRLQKYRKLKKKKLVLFSKIIVAFYLVIFSFSYLTGGTIAYFNTSNQENIILEAGTWFEGSKLEFIGKGNQNEKSCPEVEITVQIKNTKFKMQGTTKYEVYITDEKGNPQNHGELVKADGVVPQLDQGEIASLTYIAEKEGFYMFKAYQRDGYEGNDREIWSEKIKVKCKKTKSEKENEESEVIEETNEASEGQEQQNVEQDLESEDASNELDSTVDEPIGPEDTNVSQPDENQENHIDETESNPVEEDHGKDNLTEEENNIENEMTNNQPTEEGETNEETN